MFIMSKQALTFMLNDSAGSQPLNPPGIFCEASLADEGTEPSCPQLKYELTVK